MWGCWNLGNVSPQCNSIYMCYIWRGLSTSVLGSVAPQEALALGRVLVLTLGEL